jgi:hypothetical protein
MEPRPLLEDGATEIEKALLRAGRADGPRKEAGAHLLAALAALPPTGGPPVGPGPSPAGAAVKSVAYARLVKVALLAVGLGGVAVVTHHLVRPAGVAPPALPARPVVSETVPVAVPGAAPASAASAPAADVPSAGEGRGRRASHAGRVRESGRETGDSPVDRSLGNETRALDRVRESLDAHRPTEALRLLEEYQRNFPQGRLRPEAMVLRLAALVRAGRHGAADALAGQLLADEAYQTYAPRIRSLLREAKP